MSVDTENTRGKWQFLLFRYCLLSGNHPHLQLVRFNLIIHGEVWKEAESYSCFPRGLLPPARASGRDVGLFQAWGGKQRVSQHIVWWLPLPWAGSLSSGSLLTSTPPPPNTVGQQLPSSIPCHLHEQVLFKAELGLSPVCHPAGSRLEPWA